MMQLTPQKIAAIKALADDVRGDPNTRAVAKAKLEQYRREQPEMFHLERLGEAVSETIKRWNNPPNPRMKKTPEWAKLHFMNTENWNETSKGNQRIDIEVKGATYRIVIFKKASFGWTRIELDEDDVTFSPMRYATRREAMEGAWLSLMSI